MPTKAPPTLYHFTCDHGYEGIQKTGVLVTHPNGLLSALGPLLWLTDDAEPTRDSVGLTSTYLDCDRLAHRYIVHTRAAVPWVEVRARANPEIVAILERFSAPEHWWVARRMLTASEFTYDPTWEEQRAAKR